MTRPRCVLVAGRDWGQQGIPKCLRDSDSLVRNLPLPPTPQNALPDEKERANQLITTVSLRKIHQHFPIVEVR